MNNEVPLMEISHIGVHITSIHIIAMNNGLSLMEFRANIHITSFSLFSIIHRYCD